MTISELVAALEQIKAEHGDLECNSYACLTMLYPAVVYKLCSNECLRYPRFWHPLDGESKRGEKVVRL